MRRATRVLASLAGTILVLAPATAYSEDLRGVISTTRVIREDSRLVGDSSTRIAETWAQEALLARNEQPALRVYAVWFNMFPGDSREYWRPDLLTDSRVVHLWDDERSVGRLYYQLLPKIWERRAVGTRAGSTSRLT